MSFGGVKGVVVADTSTTDSSGTDGGNADGPAADHSHLTVMQRFWSRLAVQLGKHAGLVTVVGLLVTLALGLGITQLKFATGQDSYLNKNEQVYKDNVVYQRLFGGEAMLTVITMEPGHDRRRAVRRDRSPRELTRFHDALTRSGQVESVVTPLTILQFSDSLVNEPGRQPDHERRGQGPARGAGGGAARVARGRGPHRRHGDDAATPQRNTPSRSARSTTPRG